MVRWIALEVPDSSPRAVVRRSCERAARAAPLRLAAGPYPLAPTAGATPPFGQSLLWRLREEGPAALALLSTLPNSLAPRRASECSETGAVSRGRRVSGSEAGSQGPLQAPEPLVRAVTSDGPICENTGVGLEDRDWYREQPSRAWKNRWRTDPVVSGGERRWSDRRRTRGLRRRLMTLALAGGVGAAAVLGAQHRGDVQTVIERGIEKIRSLSDSDGRSALRPIVPLDPAADPKVVHLRRRPGLDVPATRVTRWTLNDPRLGLVEVYVPVGRTPREAFTIALAERGFQVVR